MSRSGYTEDCEYLDLWRGAVGAAICGKRGQAFLRELVAALDAMPEKKLLRDVLVSDEGCCAIGAVAVARRLDVSKVDPDEPHQVGKLFGIAHAMAAEIEEENDQEPAETPEQRWQRMRDWAVKHIRLEADEALPKTLGEAE